MNSGLLAEKTRIAEEHLCHSIDLFSADRAPFSVQILGGTAAEILRRAASYRGIRTALEHLASKYPSFDHKKLGTELNTFRNAFKHFRDTEAESDLKTIGNFSDFFNDHTLDMAAWDYENVTGHLRPSIRAMHAWHSWLYGFADQGGYRFHYLHYTAS